MLHSQLRTLSLALLACLAGSSALADRLELRGGAVLNGHYMGGSRKLVHFVDESGELRKVKVVDIRSLRFSEGASEDVVTVVPTLPIYQVPVGTLLQVSLTQPIDIRTTRSGQLIKGVLDEAVSVDGKVVLPVGTHVLGRISEQWRKTGGTSSSIIGLKLTSLSMGGKRHRLSTEALPLHDSVSLHTLIPFRLSSPLALQVDLARRMHERDEKR